MNLNGQTSHFQIKKIKSFISGRISLIFLELILDATKYYVYVSGEISYNENLWGQSEPEGNKNR